MFVAEAFEVPSQFAKAVAHRGVFAGPWVACESLDGPAREGLGAHWATLFEIIAEPFGVVCASGAMCELAFAPTDIFFGEAFPSEGDCKLEAGAYTTVSSLLYELSSAESCGGCKASEFSRCAFAVVCGVVVICELAFAPLDISREEPVARGGGCKLAGGAYTTVNSLLYNFSSAGACVGCTTSVVSTGA